MSLSSRVQAIRERIATAAIRSGRDPADVRLMAVSKFHSAECVEEALSLGLDLFGESRVAEAIGKFPAVLCAHPGVELHMIGSLQRNKVKDAVPLFSCIESVDRDSLILELQKRSALVGKKLDILLEYHCGEDSKSGYPDLDSLLNACELVLCSPSLSLKGLMTMAPLSGDQGVVRSAFRRLRTARDSLTSRYPELDLPILSMGMSGDFETAVEEGSTLVRIGTALFGGPA